MRQFGIAFVLLIVNALLITACAGGRVGDVQTANEAEVDLKNLGPAPELTNTVWLNTEQPLRLADLRGKVVAIDMWTFG